MTVRPTARAINRPLLIAGIERKMLGMSVLIAVVITANIPEATGKLAFIPFKAVVGFGLFTALVSIAKFATRRDDRLLQILASVWRQKAVYDPHLRQPFRMEIV